MHEVGAPLQFCASLFTLGKQGAESRMGELAGTQSSEWQEKKVCSEDFNVTALLDDTH